MLNKKVVSHFDVEYDYHDAIRYFLSVITTAGIYGLSFYLRNIYSFRERGYIALWWCPICRSTGDRITAGLYVYSKGSVHPFMKTCIIVVWVF